MFSLEVQKTRFKLYNIGKDGDEENNSRKVYRLNYSREKYILEDLKNQVGSKSSWRKSPYVVAKN